MLSMRRIAPFVWYGFIFASSCKSVNGDSVEAKIRARYAGAERERMLALWRRWWWLPVKGWHATEFAILYGLCRAAGLRKGDALFMVSLGAALDEFHQTFVEGRTGTPRDVLIDMGGALAAAGVEALSLPRRAEGA